MAHESLAQKLGKTILTRDARAKEDEVSWLSEHNVNGGGCSGGVHQRSTYPALEDGSVGLTEMPDLSALDVQGLEHFARKP